MLFTRLHESAGYAARREELRLAAPLIASTMGASCAGPSSAMEK